MKLSDLKKIICYSIAALKLQILYNKQNICIFKLKLQKRQYTNLDRF